MITKVLVKELNKLKGIDNPVCAHISISIENSISDQQQIGWIQLVYGLHSRKWQDAQDEWIQKRAMKWKPLVEKWSRNIMRLLLEISWEMWEDRNEFLHQVDHPWNQQEEQ